MRNPYCFFFVVCEQVLPLVSKMTIDSKGEMAMTRYRGRIVKSDHRMLKLEIDLKFHKEKEHSRVEVFNVRNVKCQKLFYEFTSRNNIFSSCFSSPDEDLNVQFNRWQRKLNKANNSCFRKHRVSKDDIKNQSILDDLLTKKKTILRKKVLTQEDDESIDKIEREITEEISDKEFEKLENVLGDLGTDTNTSIWKEMRKAFPSKNKPLPTGVMNNHGKVITHPKEKRDVTLAHFEHRMRKRAVKEEVIELEELNKNVFEKDLKYQAIKSPSHLK